LRQRCVCVARVRRYVTRSCRELQVLCEALGGRAETIMGLAGVGDLMLTAFGDLSRNRTCGEAQCQRDNTRRRIFSEHN